MIGKDTLFCDGHTWNGSVPMCPGECCEATLSYKSRKKTIINQKNFFGMIISPVPPSRPLLEVKVAGVSTSILKPGTMALITCTAQVHYLKINKFAN